MSSVSLWRSGGKWKAEKTAPQKSWGAFPTPSPSPHNRSQTSNIHSYGNYHQIFSWWLSCHFHDPKKILEIVCLHFVTNSYWAGWISKACMRSGWKQSNLLRLTGNPQPKHSFKPLFEYAILNLICGRAQTKLNHSFYWLESQASVLWWIIFNLKISSCPIKASSTKEKQDSLSGPRDRAVAFIKKLKSVNDIISKFRKWILW